MVKLLSPSHQDLSSARADGTDWVQDKPSTHWIHSSFGHKQDVNCLDNGNLFAHVAQEICYDSFSVNINFFTYVSHTVVRIIDWVAAQIIFFKCLRSFTFYCKLWYIGKSDHGLRHWDLLYNSRLLGSYSKEKNPKILDLLEEKSQSDLYLNVLLSRLSRSNKILKWLF